MIIKRILEYFPKINFIFNSILIFQVCSLILIILFGNSLINYGAFKKDFNDLYFENEIQKRKFTDKEIPLPEIIKSDSFLNTQLPSSFSEKLTFKKISFRNFGTGLLLSGKVAEGDSDKFQKKLKIYNSKDLNFIALHSPGGNVDEALKIGAEIRKKQLDTILPDTSTCLSACPYIFASGIKRIKASNSFIGVHQSYYPDNLIMPLYFAVEDIQKSQAETFRHLKKMGINTDVMENILETPPDEVYLLSRDELIKYNFVTHLFSEKI